MPWKIHENFKNLWSWICDLIFLCALKRGPARQSSAADFVNKEKSLELSHKPIEYTMNYENTVLKQPKQCNIGGKGSYFAFQCVELHSIKKIGRKWT